MQALQARLQEAGIWDEKLESEVKALWKYGIERIGNEALRDAVASFLCFVPLKFFTDHASRSGRFHPHWQNERHGTLRSIIESCVLVPPMAQYVPQLLDADLKPDQGAIDIALAATIISDTWKKEDIGDVHHGSAHGRVAAMHWIKFAHAQKLDPEIADAVAIGSIWHYGVYTPGWNPEMEIPPIAWLVHLCDAFTAQPTLATIYENKTVIT
ncbi:MAG: hypothetical protein Q8Q39_02525 [bacterium]|nr:hypothetical protein [bacterium]